MASRASTRVFSVSFDCPVVVAQVATLKNTIYTLKTQVSIPTQFSPKVGSVADTSLGIRKLDSPK